MQTETASSKKSLRTRSFHIAKAFPLIEAAIAPFKKAALFELAEDGFDTVFQQTVACMISVRTRDETTIPVAKALFAKAAHPGDFKKLSVEEVADLIAPSTFARTKAINIKAIAEVAAEDYGGELPGDEDVLLALPGIGPKCTNLVMGIACHQAKIGVDIHVHRVCNRWGYVATRTPEKTLAALEGKLPEKYWIDINRLLVPFGKHICTGPAPRCSTCPLQSMCPKTGVTNSK